MTVTLGIIPPSLALFSRFEVEVFLAMILQTQLHAAKETKLSCCQGGLWEYDERKHGRGQFVAQASYLSRPQLGQILVEGYTTSQLQQIRYSPAKQHRSKKVIHRSSSRRPFVEETHTSIIHSFLEKGCGIWDSQENSRLDQIEKRERALQQTDTTPKSNLQNL